MPYWNDVSGRRNDQEGLEVVPPASTPPDLNHLIVADDDTGDGCMPPLRMYVTLIFHYAY